MHPLVEQLQQQYPHPQQFDRTAHYDPACYCVGGTLVMSTPAVSAQAWEKELTFPGEDTLGAALMVHNVSLDPNRAELFAMWITQSNDRQEFAAAWAYLSDALEDDGKSPIPADTEED